MKINKVISKGPIEYLAKKKDKVFDLTIATVPSNAKYLASLFVRLSRTTKEGGVVILITSDSTTDFCESGKSFECVSIAKGGNFFLLDTMIYSNLGSIDPYFTSSQDRLKRYADCFKYMFVFTKGVPKTFNPIATKNVGNVWTFDDIDQHLSVSDQCAEDLILTYSNEGDLVFIPYGDDGTIAKIALQYKRDWIMADVPKKDKKAIRNFIKQDVISFSLFTPDKIGNKTPKLRGKTQFAAHVDDNSFNLVTPDSSIFISGDEWNKMSKKEKKKTIKKLWKHYRKHGFPYPTFTDAELNGAFNKLCAIKTKDLILAKDNIIKRDATGLKVANAFMPHMWGIKSHGFLTPLESFNDPKQFVRAIRKSVKFAGNISDGTLRSAFRWVSGTQMVSNFRPTVAKYFYDHYSGDGRVIDYSCGYGGRLVAACASKNLKAYYGADPCKETFRNLKRLKKAYGDGTKIVLKNTGFENTVFQRGGFDLCFSSPPYFNQEEYGDEADQSFINFNTKEKWRDNFLYGAIIKKCWNYLKPGGYFAINIANVQMYKDLEEDTVRLARKRGFLLRKTYLMSLSRLFTGAAFKYEPIFLFQKPK